MSIGLVQKAKIGVDVLGDFLSAPRNILNGATQGASAALPIMVVAQGILAFLGGVHTTATSFCALKAARKMGDGQGVALNSLGTLAGLGQITLGSAASTSGAATLGGNVLVAASAGAVIAPALLGIYGLFLGKSALMLKHVSAIKKALLKNDDELKAFLEEQYANNPEHVKRVIGEAVAAKIEGLGRGERVDMVFLRACITRECLKQTITHGIVIFICCIGILATIASLVLATSCPLLAPALFAIGATLWIFVDLLPLHLKLRDLLVNRKLGKLTEEVLPVVVPELEEAVESAEGKRPPNLCLRVTRGVIGILSSGAEMLAVTANALKVMAG